MSEILNIHASIYNIHQGMNSNISLPHFFYEVLKLPRSTLARVLQLMSFIVRFLKLNHLYDSFIRGTCITTES
jgi:hypothetical protein